jgi:hypothetical protein
MALWSNTDEESGKPKYLSSSDKSKTFGMDTTEITAGSDNVTAVALVSAGARYTEGQYVTFSGGGGSGAEAGTAGGGANNNALTGIVVTNVGSGYTSAPTVVVPLPRRTVLAQWVNIEANAITYPSHRLNAGDVVKYFHGGGTPIAGLTNNTTYYVISSGLLTNAFKLSALDGGTEVDITGTGNNAQYFELQSEVNRATAVATLGYGSGRVSATHTGWVLRTVGTGGRAGRIQTETLVAMGSMVSDSSEPYEDTVLPDA